MIDEKEELITNILNKLLNILNIQQINKIKEILIIEMKDIEIKYKEKSLIVSGDETNAKCMCEGDIKTILTHEQYERNCYKIN